MPRSREYHGANDTTDMVFKTSRPLTYEESHACARWFADQNFFGRVCEDVTFWTQDGYEAGGHFNDPRDLILFKLTWC